MINTNIIESEELLDINFKSLLARAYSESGLPKKYHFATLDNTWSTEYSSTHKLSEGSQQKSLLVKKIINAYIQNIDNIISGSPLQLNFPSRIQLVDNLILDGGKDSGKTLLLSIIGQHAINSGHSVKYLNWPEFIDLFHSFESRNTNSDLFNDLCKVEILIFDNVFDYQAPLSQFFHLLLDRLIAARTSAGLITICAIDTINSSNPVFGSLWNSFTRESFTLHLPGHEYETNTKRNRTSNYKKSN